MLFEVQHRTELTYSQRISESVMEVRLTPRSDDKSDAPPVSHRRRPGLPGIEPRGLAREHRPPVLGRRVPRPRFSSCRTPRSPPILSRVDVGSVADPMRSPRTSHRLLDFLSFGGPVQRDPRIVALAERIKLHECPRAADAVLRVTEAVRDSLTYQKGVTNSLTTVAEALDHGAGVCQDFSHIALAMLRLIGIPARYVSGYLYRSDLSEVETHAWCEAFIPSIGWFRLRSDSRGARRPKRT